MRDRGALITDAKVASDLLLSLFAALPEPGTEFDEASRARWTRWAEATFDAVYGPPDGALEALPPPRQRFCFTCGEEIPADRAHSIFCSFSCVRTPRQVLDVRASGFVDVNGKFRPPSATFSAPAKISQRGKVRRQCERCQELRGTRAFDGPSRVCRRCKDGVKAA